MEPTENYCHEPEAYPVCGRDARYHITDLLFETTRVVHNLRSAWYQHSNYVAQIESQLGCTEIRMAELYQELEHSRGETRAAQLARDEMRADKEAAWSAIHAMSQLSMDLKMNEGEEENTSANVADIRSYLAKLLADNKKKALELATLRKMVDHLKKFRSMEQAEETKEG